jgi:hypothetical protein
MARSISPERSDALFAADSLVAVELTALDIPELQRFFELNPEYFLTVYGRAAAPDEAYEAIHGALPPGWPFTKKWLIGFVDETGSLVGMANVVSDLLASGVWHIGLFTPPLGCMEAAQRSRSTRVWSAGLWIRAHSGFAWVSFRATPGRSASGIAVDL